MVKMVDNTIGVYDNAMMQILYALDSEDLKDLASRPSAPAVIARCDRRAESYALAPPKRSADIAAERRPITVMFCDLVGSTALAAKLDAEDWRDLVGGYLDEASKAVTEYGGHVLKKLGDGLMALFGYPQRAGERRRARRRAGLAIQRALDDLNARNAAHGAPAACRAHRPGERAGRGRCDGRGVRRRAECRRAGAGRRRAGDDVGSPPACSGRSRGCSSPRTGARTS